MRALALLASLILAIAAAGCVNEDPVETATDEDPAPGTPTVADPQPPTPSSPPPATTPPPASPPPASPPPADDPPAPEPRAPRVDVFAWNGSLTGVGAGASTPAGAEVCCAQVAPNNSNADVEFQVPAGLKGIVVELVWTDTQFDLDLLVTASDYDPAPTPPAPYTGHRWLVASGAPAQPDGRVALALTDEEALALVGTWGAHASAKGPAHEVEFALLVSLFYDEPPASDYSAASEGQVAPSDNP